MLAGMRAYLNASEVAKLLRVNRATVTRWVRRGVIKGAIKPENTQQWRIPLEAYDKLLRSGRP
jgi:excisionase family DNA binding protein